MKYAIIAAGNGSRLAKEGITVPKPLVQINGETLIDRLIRVFCNNNATEIVVVCNEEMTAPRPHTATQTERQEHHIALYSKIDTQFYAQL